jgi:3-hydroxyisobutyrate dehydrogenase-like beta-hydroxyacid dehydrogenase
MTTQVGFIGLGRMGQPMSRHILKAGFALTVFDVQVEAMQSVVALGARAATSAREVARASDVILVMVADDAQVRAVVDDLLQDARAGAVIAVCSSIHPQTCGDLADRAHTRDVGFVDAPVARGQRGAEAGDLTVFAGGAKNDFEKCRPVFAAYAQAIFWMGAVGAGQITKTCNNLMHWSTIVACYETLTLGARLGIAPNDLRPALLAGSADSRTLRELELVKLTWPDKDMATALALADESETPVPLMEHVRALIKQIAVDDLRGLFR